MSSNRLCLNLEKTKYLWFGTRQQLGKRDTVALSNISTTMVSDTVTRNLSLLLDQELSMGDHITKLSQDCFLPPPSYSRRASLVDPKCSAHFLVHEFVCSRLDFCNSVMFGVHSYLLDHLQSILNAAARLILQIHKFSSISSAISDELHWIPVRSRIVFKQCLLVRSCLAGSAPSYLTELCIPISSVTGRRQNLRSAYRGTLVVPRVRNERYGRRGSSVSGPHL